MFPIALKARLSGQFILVLIASWAVVCGGCGGERPGGTGGTSSPRPDRLEEKPLADRVQRVRALDRLIQSGEFEKAKREARRLLVETPDDLEANLLMVKCLVGSGEIDAAILLIDSLAEQASEDRSALELEAAELAFRSGREVEGIERFERLLDSQDVADEVRIIYGRLLDSRGFSHDANRQWRLLLERQGLEFEGLVGLVFPTRAWVSPEDFGQSIESEVRKNGVMTVANALRIDGNPRRAWEILKASTTFKEGLPAAVALGMRIQASAQMYDQLELNSGNAIRLCQRYPDYWVAMGELANHLGRPEAIGCFMEVLRREPGSLDAHYGIIEALRREGESEIAEQFESQVVILDQVNARVKAFQDESTFAAAEAVEVSKRLMALGRPLESIGWQGLILERQGKSKDKIRLVQDYKDQVLAELPIGVDLQVVWCGLPENHFGLARRWIEKGFTEDAGRDSIPIQGTGSSRRAGAPALRPGFTDVAEQSGLQFRYLNADPPVERHFLIYQAFGGGVACLDFDLDGAVDFYLTQAGVSDPRKTSTHPNGLFRNEDLKFRERVAESRSDDRGYAFGVTAGDLNQDGFPDLFIGNLGRNQLFVNQGDGTFRKTSGGQSVAGEGYTSSVAMADVSGNGLTDLIEINYLDDPEIHTPIKIDRDGNPINLPGPLRFKAATDRILFSKGDGSFQESMLGGDETKKGTGLGVVVGHLNGGRGNEIFVANDLMANRLWSFGSPDASGPGWVDHGVSSGVAFGASGKPMASMGVAAADFDGNGLIDLHVTNFEKEWSNHYLQLTAGHFNDRVVAYRMDVLSHRMLGFGTQAIDFENDGDEDLLVGNGHIEDLTSSGSLFEMPTQVLVNEGERFVQNPMEGQGGYWDSRHLSRAMARCDFDRNGFDDAVITDLKTEVALLKNVTESPNHWVQLRVVGTESERDSIGALVTVNTDSSSQTKQILSGDGYQAKNEPVLTFGLSEEKLIRSVTVRWPGGRETNYSSLGADRRWVLIEGCDSAWEDTRSPGFVDADETADR